MVSMIVARVDDHSVIETLAKESSVPVINALSSLYHPLQALADLLTIQETYPQGVEGLKIAWVGDATNVLYDLAIAAVMMGVNISAATPEKYPFDQNVLKIVKESAQDGATIQLTSDPLEAVKNADIIVTDTWYDAFSALQANVGYPWVRKQKRRND
jgi:ornithine carbamoyltransferase